MKKGNISKCISVIIQKIHLYIHIRNLEDEDIKMQSGKKGVGGRGVSL